MIVDEFFSNPKSEAMLPPKGLLLCPRRTDVVDSTDGMRKCASACGRSLPIHDLLNEGIHGVPVTPHTAQSRPTVNTAANYGNLLCGFILRATGDRWALRD